MKFKKLHYIATLLLAAIIVLTTMSNSGGITGQSTTGCNNGGSCHATTASPLTLINITGLPTTYVQGQAYPLTVTVTNTAKVAAGFDLTVSAGALSAPQTGTALNGTLELRHTTPKALTAGTASWTFTWTAPATGTAIVNFFVAGNAVNLNGTNDAQDIWNIMTFSVPAAPVSIAPTVVTGAASAITSTTATVSGTVNANGASTTVTMEYGTTIAYGSTATVTPGTVTGSTVTTVSAPLTALAANTTYHYRFKGTNIVGPTNGADATFTTAINAPTVVTGAVTGITSTSATINGTVNANSGSATVTVDYGLTTAYGTTTATTPGTVTGTTATAVSLNLSTLAPATLYHYRINATSSGGTTNSADATFTTLATVAAPTILTGTPTAITFNSATINGTVNANNASTAVSIEYGLTTTYGLTGTLTPNPVTGVTVTSVSGGLTGLAAATLYHYRIVGTNSVGTTNSADATFTTAAAPAAPTVVVGTVTGITSAAAVIHGTVNANNASTAVSIEYGLTTAYGSTGFAIPNTVTGSTATAITSSLTGLQPLTTYHYRINATNSIGTTNSPDNTFTTLTNVSAPTVIVGTPSAITTTTATINGFINANNATTTMTVQYGITTTYGSIGTVAPASITGNTLQAISSALSGLTPGTTYHYRIQASNSGGTITSADATFVTLTPPGLPVVTLNLPTNISTTGATINGIVTATNATTAVSVEYGLTTTYGSTINTVPSSITGTAATPVAATLSLLNPSTTYHYRIKAVNSIGTVYSADDVFTTLNPFSLPVITLGAATSISYNRGVVNATVNASNANTTVSVEYGTSTAYGSTISAAPSFVSGTTATAISATIGQLQPNTVYHYRVKATNAAGTAYSADDIINTTHGVSVASLEAGGFLLYPNPGYTQLVLSTKDNVTVTIGCAGMDGKAITLPYRKVAANQYQIDIAQLPQGMYLLLLKSDGQSYSTRFTKM